MQTMKPTTQILQEHVFIGFDGDYGELHCLCKATMEPLETDPDSRTPHLAHVVEALRETGNNEDVSLWKETYDKLEAERWGAGFWAKENQNSEFPY